MSDRGVSDRLFDGVVRLLGRRVSRRRLLARMATAGSAITVAPLRYSLRPLSAMSAITCSDCPSSALCCDGWTTFCCTINGGLNACPSYSFMAGWWKCTNYTGSKLCNAANVRFYIDCNRTPFASCPSGCHCAQDSCSNRSTCCNIFRYGQCNTQVIGTTAVVCRMVTCENPCLIFANCNCTYFEENAVCSHEAGCL